MAAKVKFCLTNIPILKVSLFTKTGVIQAEEVRKICVEFEFDELKIEEYLKVYEIDEKYRDIPAFQWQQTQTREEKAIGRKKKMLEAERVRRREERFTVIYVIYCYNI